MGKKSYSSEELAVEGFESGQKHQKKSKRKVPQDLINAAESSNQIDEEEEEDGNLTISDEEDPWRLSRCRTPPGREIHHSSGSKGEFKALFLRLHQVALKASSGK